MATSLLREFDREIDVAKTYFMDWCPDLIVRTDIGHGQGDHKSIATASCKAELEGRSCTRRGACFEAKDNSTGLRVNSKTFTKKLG